MQKAIGIYGKEVPVDMDKHHELLISDNEEICRLLNECDNSFHEYEETLTTLNYQFIISNKDVFLNRYRDFDAPK